MAEMRIETEELRSLVKQVVAETMRELGQFRLATGGKLALTESEAAALLGPFAAAKLRGFVDGVGGQVAVGADGVMVEVHPDPDAALSDAEQQLTLEQFRAMMAELVPIHEHVRAMYASPIAVGAATAGVSAGAATAALAKH